MAKHIIYSPASFAQLTTGSKEGEQIGSFFSTFPFLYLYYFRI